MTDNDIAIRIEGIGKRYKLGETFNTTRNFRETLMSLPRHFSRKARAATERLRTEKEAAPSTNSPHVVDPRQEGGYFWALRDVNLEIKRGEAVGIIGRNGAGKSTLLKVLSRITAPTEGYAEIRGRVGALLEVGTGMHPELTGRENIYLNGAIIGMRKAEIDRKFDEIVDFAGTEAFLDTPLKRYSSGMRVRLGFSVAAHLEPEVLIVDEVLSVGDAEFRKKCLGRMDEVTRGGCTVLFVSHNMAAVSDLCTSCIFLQDGRMAQKGGTEEIINEYLFHGATTALNGEIPIEAHAEKSPKLEIFRARFEDAQDLPVTQLVSGMNTRVVIDYMVHDPSEKYNIGVVIRSPDERIIAGASLRYSHHPLIETPHPGRGRLALSCRLPLLPGTYRWDLRVKNQFNMSIDQIEGMEFMVHAPNGQPKQVGLADIEPVWHNASLSEFHTLPPDGDAHD